MKSPYKEPGFIDGCRDYFYLLDRGYPERGSLKLVGDRYKLTRDERSVLYRGISSKEKSELRKSLATADITGENLYIDGYNVLFTMLNYRLGRLTFISTDGILRDAGSLHGRFRDHKTFLNGVDQLTEYLSGIPGLYVDVYLDSPVSHSEQHAEIIRSRLVESGVKGACHVVKSADHFLKQPATGIIATSDTAIIESAKLPVVDLPAAILTALYHPDFFRIGDVITE